MRLRALRPAQGICFAWLPVWTPEGKVWLEWVHFKWNEGWGWGSSGHYSYRRFRYDLDAFGHRRIANFDDDAHARAERINDAILHSEQDYGIKAKHLGDLPAEVQRRLLSGAKAYATPPGDPATVCRNFNPDGPTPCHYPHCMVGGIDNCEVCIGRDTDE